MVAVDKFFIPNDENKLEAESFQSSLGKIKPITLICHPHPQYGGNMYNNVVSGVFKKLIEHDCSCLRFNFRGVGSSTGSHSNGTGEVSDVHACIDFLIKEGFERIVVCGYSYGAAIGCSTVNYSDKIIGFISIAFPWGFMENYKQNSQTSKPKLFIQGNRDQVAQFDQFLENYESYSDPKTSLILDTDHFYGGYEEQVATEVLKFLGNF
ncbi:MAG: alpha/beta fold hydrolase [Candidatus Lokiarchaeota archaeon]|nr:alpha/beta fold hydrolase [Candidatus Lokiarchaeota archaeon]